MTRECHAGICGSRGLRCPRPPDPGNLHAVNAFRDQATRHWYQALRRRSQRSRLNCECTAWPLDGSRRPRSPIPGLTRDSTLVSKPGAQCVSSARWDLCGGRAEPSQAKARPYRDTEELRPWLKDHWPEIRSQLEAGTYQPQPVRRVMIPKPSGGLRMLGVPAAVDRLICQAIAQVLTPVFDPQFHPHSFGFRPGRSQHHAVERARQFIADDAAWCVDFDLDSFFDRVQHDALMARVARRVHDKRGGVSWRASRNTSSSA